MVHFYTKQDPSKVKDFSTSLKEIRNHLQRLYLVFWSFNWKINLKYGNFLPIFEEFNKSNLLKDYKDRVDTLVAAMKENPDMIVEVSSYTDCRGSKDYNLKLSQKKESNHHWLCQ